MEVLPVEGIPEVDAGDDLAGLIRAALPPLRDGDVLVVTQKVVSKAEGRVVAGDRREQVDSQTRRVVARRGDLVIAETHHGFVCANAGVDASNVADGMVALLPVDPDASAAALSEQLGTPVVVSDTFGRAWRMGLVDVAIGCAGLPALIDLRGDSDHTGRVLEATVMAFADQIAAAAGLVMGKDAMVPVAVVRGLNWSQEPSAASELVRPPQEDMFRESPLQAISSRRTIRAFGDGTVPREVVAAAVEAACTAPAPHHTRPWSFVVLDSSSARRKLLDAMADAWRRDLEADGIDPDVITQRIERSEALLGAAPTLIVPLFSQEGGHDYPDDARRGSEREMFTLSAGAAVQNLLVALHAQGFASAWVSSGIFCRERVLEVLGLDAAWSPAGTIAVGPLPADPPAPRPPLQVGDHLRFEPPTLD